MTLAFLAAPRAGGVMITLVAAAIVIAGPAKAQRASENAVTAASDAFGTSIGNEKIGLYSDDEVRGFSPVTAGNRRLDGLYFDLGGNGLTSRLITGSDIRVGVAALTYPLPAPSGIVDYRLRSSGDDLIVSVVGGQSNYGGHFLELDSQIPLINGRASLAAGAGYSADQHEEGRQGTSWSLAILPRVRFATGEVTAFWSAADNRGDTRPLLVTDGPTIPPEIHGRRFYGQDWAQNSQRSMTYGMLGRIELGGDFTLRAGVFESRSTRYSRFTDLFLHIAPDGGAQELVVSEPEAPSRWTSGELRLSWANDGEHFRQAIHLSARGRDKRLVFGGGDAADLGSTFIGEANPVPAPRFDFGDTTANLVRQATLGVAYVGRWDNFLEFNVGLQKTDYTSTVRQSDLTTQTQASPWLYNATAAITPKPWLALYAGYTRGLEETAPAPGGAANRGEAQPASLTQQREAGVKLVLGRTRIVADVFEIERPYYSTDASNIYAALGTVRNRGAELSVVSQIGDSLSLVGGVVFFDPRVSGEAITAGDAGARPVGSTGQLARLDLEYRFPLVKGLSFDMSVNHTGRRVASTQPYPALGNQQLEVREQTTLDIGARYQFSVRQTPVTARILLANVLADRVYEVASSNTFFIGDTRRLSFQVSAIFDKPRVYGWCSTAAE
ncbi:MAG: TonB-dependent receptor [Chthoniobacterales bacterium]|nr:TonB-dependent receptor [Chthoniobacterales bacterium]